MSEAQTEEQGVEIHVSPDLDYVYRDVFHIFVGASEVILEFGNRHPSMPERATISNRIVISMSNAIDLQHRLQNTIAEAQQRIRQQYQTQSSPPPAAPPTAAPPPSSPPESD